MKDNRKFRIDDKIVRFGRVYRIFKIKKQKTFKGKKEKTIFFKPYFKTKKEERDLIFSLPIEKISKINIRKPFSKNEIRELLSRLSEKSDVKEYINVTKAREVLTQNDPNKIVEILRTLWGEKNDESKNLTKSKKDIFKLSIKHLVEEIAFVLGISLVTARKRVRKALEKSTK